MRIMYKPGCMRLQKSETIAFFKKMTMSSAYIGSLIVIMIVSSNFHVYLYKNNLHQYMDNFFDVCFLFS
jgi:hypothetical protein